MMITDCQHLTHRIDQVTDMVLTSSLITPFIGCNDTINERSSVQPIHIMISDCFCCRFLMEPHCLVSSLIQFPVAVFISAVTSHGCTILLLPSSALSLFQQHFHPLESFWALFSQLFFPSVRQPFEIHTLQICQHQSHYLVSEAESGHLITVKHLTNINS